MKLVAGTLLRTLTASLYLCGFRAASQFSKPVARSCIPHAHERSSLGGSSESRAVGVQGEACERRLVRRDRRRALHTKELEAQVLGVLGVLGVGAWGGGA